VLAGLSITPTRQTRVDFSIPYVSTTIAVLFRKADAYDKPDDLMNRHVGAQLGTTWGQVAQDLAGKLHLKVHSLSNNLMLVEELKSKAVDAVILEEAQAKKFVLNNPVLTYFTLEDFSSEFAIALQQGSLLKASIDNALKVLEEEGKLTEIRKKWLE
jgi:polar amino acid transport system substrate-binding protein